MLSITGIFGMAAHSVSKQLPEFGNWYRARREHKELTCPLLSFR
jgi:hypothetical protein